MVYIVVKSWYPSHITEKVNERYLEMLQKFPPDNSLGDQVVPVAARASKDGFETLGLTLVKEGKFDEALLRIGGMMTMFSDIEGYEFSIETWVTVQEAQKMQEQ